MEEACIQQAATEKSVHISDASAVTTPHDYEARHDGTVWRMHSLSTALLLLRKRETRTCCPEPQVVFCCCMSGQ